jgi:carbamoyltransferase
MTYVLGINPNHNCTACLLKDGEVVACTSEERFSGIKNHLGFPLRATDFVLRFAGIGPEDLDLVVTSFTTPMRNFWTAEQMKEYFVRKGGLGVEATLQQLRAKGYHPASWGLRAITFLSRNFFYPRERHEREISAVTGVPREKITGVDHHVAHAYVSYYGFAAEAGDCLVMTYDGGGDETCGSIFLARDSVLRRMVSIPNSCSLASLYADVTLHLGMKMIEHEYKVMGLAPYADPVGVERVYREIFEGLFEVTPDLGIRSRMPSEYFYYYLRERLFGKPLKERRSLYRFDWIAGAIQRLTEEVLVEWVKKAVEKTGEGKVALGGGVFLNVKANMEIMYRTPLQELYVCPSGGDESTAIGAAYWGYKLLCGERAKTKPVRDLYLGPSYDEGEVEEALRRWGARRKYRVEEVKDMEGHVAELLSKGKIVARFRGRMEFGARALGNRSILADPSRFDLVRELNEQIKQRDFWMPFAPTILAERQHDYLLNPKNIPAPHMVLAFKTTPLAWKELSAALHPYDKTCRPQVLEKKTNESYYRLIKEFEKLTGIGAVLNTSFNLHGDPIVCSPDDALRTFENSGLRYLALENYLISKE